MERADYEDLEIIIGKYAELLGLLQERYGHAKEQAEREINGWAKRLRVYSVAELTALRDDVAGLSASVGELVRRQTAVATGLDMPSSLACSAICWSTSGVHTNPGLTTLPRTLPAAPSLAELSPIFGDGVKDQAAAVWA